MIETLLEKGLNCSGCGACGNACPENAIAMQADDEGFLKPYIIKDRCIGCEVCKNVCPMLNGIENLEHEMTPRCYAAWAADAEIRQDSSSGGIFGLMAREILKRGGAVFGASLQADMVVRHVRVDTVQALNEICKSKYVQSEIGYTYREVEKILADGREVLFAGTPCQIAGLHAYLQCSESKLYTIDLLCHGVPSAKMLRDEMQERFGLENILKIDFRPIKKNSMVLKVYLKDGTGRSLSLDECFYEQAFHSNLSLRESCYHCKLCAFPRIGDITLGDFWQAGEFSKDLEKEKGVSALLVNSQKGSELLACIRSHLAFCEEAPLDYLSKNRIRPDIEAHPGREYFHKLYKTHTFVQSARYALQGRYDVGLVGNWSYPNYGSSLTYYALYSTLEAMNLSVRMVTWPQEAEWKPFEKQELFEKMPYPEYAVAPLVERRRDMKRFNDECDTFVLGSDQLLNNNLYRWFDKFVQMDWAYSTKRKIAYAASFGTDYVWGSSEEWGEMAHFMRQFDAFSVREDSGVRLAREQLGITARHVLDPVFLPDRAIYDALADASSEQPKDEKYVFSYTLDYSTDKEQLLVEYAEKTQNALHVATDAALTDAEESGWKQPVLRGISTERWLSEIRASQFMITDSFHGMCFAIIFGVPFIAVCNMERGKTRFESLLRQLGLENRLVLSVEELKTRSDELCKPIDYEKVHEKLKVLKRRSLRWLKESLALPVKQKTLTDYDILSRAQDQCEDRLNGRIDWAIGRIDQDKADINGRMDWAIGRLDQDKADINGRVDGAIERIDRDKEEAAQCLAEALKEVRQNDANINGRMDWAIGRLDQDKADINGRVDGAIERIDRDKEETVQSLEEALKEVRQNDANINGRMDWAIGRIDQDRTDINGRVDGAIERINRDKEETAQCLAEALKEVRQNDANINGRMDWAIGRIDQDRADINGRIDGAIERIDRDKEEAAQCLEEALKEVRQNDANINGRMDWAIGRIDTDKEELLAENASLRQKLQLQDDRLMRLESELKDVNDYWVLRLRRWIRKVFSKK